MSPVVALAFAVTYLGMAFGRIPGLRIDRAGIALVAVALLLVTGTVDLAPVNPKGRRGRWPGWTRTAGGPTELR